MSMKQGWLHQEGSSATVQSEGEKEQIRIGEPYPTSTGTERQPSESNTVEVLKNYLVVGVFNRHGSIPEEELVVFESGEDLRTGLRLAARRLRGWRRLVSLKHVSKFGLYEVHHPYLRSSDQQITLAEKSIGPCLTCIQCHPLSGSHYRIDLDSRTEATLSQLFYDYQTKDTLFHPAVDALALWSAWIYEAVNEKHAKPVDAKYSLELKLGWSSLRVTVLTSAPVILSLVIGTWYMQTYNDVIAAWTIALYIITAAGGTFVNAVLYRVLRMRD